MASPRLSLGISAETWSLPQKRVAELVADRHSLSRCSEGTTDHVPEAMGNQMMQQLLPCGS